MGAWGSQAERVAYLAADRLNLIWIIPAEGSGITCQNKYR
jgi:hypothetical protein